MNSSRCCPYCQESFQPSIYRPEQRVCSQAKCQRRRRNDDHRQRIRTDAGYADDVRASQRKWRQANPDYSKIYRRENPEAVERNRQKQKGRDRKRRFVDLAKNNVALDLKRDASEVWLFGSGIPDLVKNNLASVKVFIYQDIPAVPDS